MEEIDNIIIHQGWNFSKGVFIMSNILIKVCKSSVLILRMVAMIILQFIVAIIKARPDILFADIKLLLAMTFTLVFLLSDFFFGTGVLIGVAIRQDEEEFDILYNKYSTYFENLYHKLDKNVRQLYSLEQIVNLKINI